MSRQLMRSSLVLAGAVALGAAFAGESPALPLDGANVLFEEDFVGETALPTSNGVFFAWMGLTSGSVPTLDPVAGTATITRNNTVVTIVSPPVDPLSESSNLSVAFVYPDELGGARAVFESFSPIDQGNALLSAGVGVGDSSGLSALALVQLFDVAFLGFVDAVLLTVVEVDALGLSPVTPVFIDVGSLQPTMRTAILAGTAFEVELVLDPDAVPPTMQAALRVPSLALEVTTPASPTTYFASPADATELGAIVAAQNYATGPPAPFSFDADDSITATLVELQARSVPEPASVTALGMGFAAVLGLARLRETRAARGAT